MSIVLDGTSGITTNSGTVVSTTDATISGLTVGKGGGAVTQNTVVGASAGSANTTGKITAVGYLAARFNTTGSGNTALGGNDAAQDGALYLNTTGNYNIAVGTGSVASNTTGSSNTGIGYSALQNNTTASNNTAVGYQAGYTGTTASNNAILGYQAGFSITTGKGNCLIGSASGRGLTTGSKNTFVGSSDDSTNYSAGYYVTTGSSNSILGNFSGNQGGLDIRTSSNYIVLSDGDGNPRIYVDGSGLTAFKGANTSYGGSINWTDTSTWGAVFRTSRGDNNGFCLLMQNLSATSVGSIQTTSTATTYATSSDYRLKENIAPMQNSLNVVQQLKPVTYKWKEDGSDGQGFIAHELQAVIPDAVVGEKDAVDSEGKPVYQGIDTSFLVATLTAALQELKQIVDTQAAEIAELKAKVA